MLAIAVKSSLRIRLLVYRNLLSNNNHKLSKAMLYSRTRDDQLGSLKTMHLAA